MTVIGGGNIGLEMGNMWSRLGSEVTVVESLSSIGGAQVLTSTRNFRAPLLRKAILKLVDQSKVFNFKLNTN
jgi:dihydrolipoamide dehydrogenase